MADWLVKPEASSTETAAGVRWVDIPERQLWSLESEGDTGLQFQRAQKVFNVKIKTW